VSHDLATEPAPLAFRWRQKFSGLPGAVWVHVTDTDVSAIGAAILLAAEIEETDPAKLKSEFLEIIRQALSSSARALSARMERESVCETGGESAETAQGAWSTIELQAAGLSATVSIAIEPALCAALEPPEPAPKSRNYDLLLDVELPVSVSFGRAQVTLKDVLKLTTGSVVELNRDIGDPVEVIVNNCVIARGEVVVVRGNFGVRIQQVISRQERLRTLK
jgi:flagellar motor switch protein FliN/FliY